MHVHDVIIDRGIKSRHPHHTELLYHYMYMYVHVQSGFEDGLGFIQLYMYMYVEPVMYMYTCTYMYILHALIKAHLVLLLLDGCQVALQLLHVLVESLGL